MNITRGKKDSAQKVVIYGQEGVGKSTLSSEFPEPLYIDTEGSTGNLDVARLDKPTSWTMLINQINWVKANPTVCKTLVIDTVDWAERLCIESVCAQHQKKGIEDFGYGNGYTYVAEEFGRLLNLLQDLIDVGINIVLTAHAQIRKFEQPDEMGAYDRWELKLGKKTTGQTAPLVKEWADMILFCAYKTYVVSDDKSNKKKARGGQRVMYTEHHPAWDAKNRHGLPPELPLNFTSIAHIFSKQSTVAPQPQNVPPTQTAQPAVQQVSSAQQEVVEEPPSQEVQPAQSTVPNAETTTSPPLNPNIPKALRDLMEQHQVSEEDLKFTVSLKGYYPKDTDIVNYDPAFIEGVLVGAWPQVYAMVVENRTLPF